MERMMGHSDTPVRRILNYASEHFTKHLPIVYVHTVVERGADGKLVVRGLYISDDISGFDKGAALSLKVNFEMLDAPLKKVVVYLDPSEFKSTWLGNKSIYRTRMAMADGGELIVLAPGLKEFGEDKEIDRLIRKYGYRGTPADAGGSQGQSRIAEQSQRGGTFHSWLVGSRFNITYCPGQLTRQEIESVNFQYADLKQMTQRYDPAKLKDGWNTMPDGEKIFTSRTRRSVVGISGTIQGLTKQTKHRGKQG